MLARPAAPRLWHPENAPSYWPDLSGPGRTKLGDTGDIRDFGTGGAAAASRGTGVAFTGKSSLSFAGTDVVTIPDSAGIFTTQLTFACVCQLSSISGTPFLVCCRVSGAYAAWGVYITSAGAIGFESRTASSQDASTSGGFFVTNRRVVVVVTFNSGTITFYCNGVKVGSGSTSGNSLSTTGTGSYFGGYSPSVQRCSGTFEDMQLSGYAWSDKEASRYANDPWWRLRPTARTVVAPLGTSWIRPSPLIGCGVY